MIRNKYPRDSKGIGELPLWEDIPSNLRVYKPLGSDHFYKIFDGQDLLMFVENHIFYDFTATSKRFDFKYLHMENKEKVIDVIEGQTIVNKLDCDYSLIGYGHCLKVCSGRITRNISHVEREITYHEEGYYINQVLVAKESVGGNLFQWLFKIWSERKLVAYDEYVRIDFDSTLLKREEALMLLLSRFAGLRE